MIRQLSSETPASSNSFRDVLYQVTIEKLEELKTQKDRLTKHYQEVLDKATSKPTELDQLRELQLGWKNSPVPQGELNDGFNRELKNLEVLLKSAESDPCISSKILQHWITKIKDEMNYSMKKCEYSFLFGSILNEWFDSSEANLNEVQKVDKKSAKSDDQKKKDDTIKELSEKIFKGSGEFDRKAFDSFLQDLFTLENIEHKDLIHNAKLAVKNFAEDFHERSINQYEVGCCIDGLVAADLLNEEKKATLKELKENSVALEEICTLLTNRLKNFQRWEWPVGGVYVDVRRGIAGRYRAFMDEDIITALFLQYVGVQWSITLKQLFSQIYQSKIWKRPKKFITKSIESLRQATHKKAFLSLVPKSIEEQVLVGYEPEVADTKGMQMAMACPPASFGGYAEDSSFVQHESLNVMRCKRSIFPQEKVKPLDVKGQMLHLVSGEIKLNHVLHPKESTTVVCSDLEWFGPSLIHECILALMEFFSVPKPWLDFFSRFLQTPLKFAHDSSPQVRKRGVPISHALSTLFGESTLFLMDFLVNKKTGINLFRVFDDFWFWHHDQEKVQLAWTEMKAFVNLIGLKFNEEKSGSLCTFSNEQLTKMKSEGKKTNLVQYGKPPLPQKTIRWGFIELHSDGVFRLDENSLETFIKEMVKLLDESKNVMSWVTTYNRYMDFFVRCFGKQALIFGSQHLEQIEICLKNIRIKAFGGSGNPLPVLVNKFEIFKIVDNKEILDGWAYLPMERGGLGLGNPLIEIIAMKEAYEEYHKTQESSKSDQVFMELLAKDKAIWDRYMAGELHNLQDYDLEPKDEEGNDAKVRKSIGPDSYGAGYHPVPVKVVECRKISFEEFCARRETGLGHWYDRYVQMMQSPSAKGPVFPNDVYNILSSNGIESVKDQWLYALYASQLENYFGSYKFIDTKLIPMSMITSIRASKLNF